MSKKQANLPPKNAIKPPSPLTPPLKRLIKKNCFFEVDRASGKDKTIRQLEGDISDIELARVLAATMSGNVSEWPQLKPLLIRLANQLEEREK